MNRLDVKIRNSKQNKETWKDPVKRKNRVDALKGAMNRPDVKERNSKAVKEAMNRPDVKDKISGSNHYNWNPNREEVFAPYTEKFFDPIYREEIKREQNNIDPITKEPLLEKSRLHHIDYNKQNDSRENLIWLNLATHAKTNTKRRKWKVLLLKINKSIATEFRVLIGGKK